MKNLKREWDRKEQRKRYSHSPIICNSNSRCCTKLCVHGFFSVKWNDLL